MKKIINLSILLLFSGFIKADENTEILKSLVGKLDMSVEKLDMSIENQRELANQITTVSKKLNDTNGKIDFLEADLRNENKTSAWEIDTNPERLQLTKQQQNEESHLNKLKKFAQIESSNNKRTALDALYSGENTNKKPFNDNMPDTINNTPGTSRKFRYSSDNKNITDTIPKITVDTPRENQNPLTRKSSMPKSRTSHRR